MTKNNEKTRKNVLVRLRRIEGQVRGIQRMMEEEADCMDILTQISAVKSAINQVGIIIFEKHAQECIVKAMDEDRQEENLKEIVNVMGRLIK
ncbi:MAG: metal-sensitive transcriptional regulator [Syntrophomonas sp.]|uniref:metal-sensitive transcriptional regulator n=1 Tax=Syntrophomonas sp. TaxID=2053627 RepID=UPI002629AAAE|nr:metal-sensitive transcriptional regulator [Syntrophomonas sp.]MDD2510680.1 metal-sensitive transcriptional regulator [Syntrophomonas sp.]MDD3878704.1 metal-sensitive transcriptional regulator [Syntrophomonas sp.]MDD4626160.1 metal-sensitive transcriptional regulator [Syntrophomonas sp.]